MGQKLFFTSKHCGGCSEVKRKLKEEGVSRRGVKEIDCDTEAGRRIADKHGIEYTPTLIKDGKKYVGGQVVCGLKNEC